MKHSQLLTRHDTLLLRGLAILLIVVHNFAHWLPGCVDENEYTWSGARLDHLWHVLQDGGPHILLNLFSHYGHYGVAIFLFLSGFGLTRKYEMGLGSNRSNTNYNGLGNHEGHGSNRSNANFNCPGSLESRGESIPVLGFLRQHAGKLWHLMLPAVVVFYVVGLFVPNTPHYEWNAVVELLTFTVNLNPHRPMLLGPWWWFSLMMQFYIVWRLFVYRRSDRALGLLTLVCLALQLWTTWLSLGQLDNSSCVMTWLHYNMPCSMLPFALGVYVARHPATRLLHPALSLPALVVVVLGSWNVWVWPLGGVMSVIALVPLIQWACHGHCRQDDSTTESSNTKNSTTESSNTENGTTEGSCTEDAGLGARLLSPLAWVGGISAWVFALHPVVRHATIGMARQPGAEPYMAFVLYLTLSLLAGWLFTTLDKRCSQRAR